MVMVRVGNVSLLIEGDLPMEVSDELRQTLSYVVPGFEYTTTFQHAQEKAEQDGREAWDGRKTLAKWDRRGFRCPTGLYSYIKDLLNKHGIQFGRRDERPAATTSPGWSLVDYEPRDYQVEPIEQGLERQRGVLQAATGAGKTEMMMDMIVRASAFPTVFYVNSCDLLEQTHDRFARHIRYDGKKVKIGRVGAGHFDPQPITIATVQTAERVLTGQYTKYMFDDHNADDKKTKLDERQKAEFADLIADAQFAYCDECHHVSCETIQHVLDASHGARFRFGGSASPWRDDGLDIMIEAAFGRKFCSISASFLIDAGYLVRPTIVFNHFSQALGPTGNFPAHYTTYVVENEARNEFIVERTLHHVDAGKPTIILVKWAKHAVLLSEMIGDSCEVLTSSGKKKKSPKQRKLHLERMRNRELMIIIATTLLDEGVDVPAASAGIFAGGGKSSTRELQRVGRFIRRDPSDPGKDHAVIEEFHEHTKWLTGHAVKRRKILKEEPAFDILDNRVTMEM
jgi:superfamily II DNA or RNA helicase